MDAPRLINTHDQLKAAVAAGIIPKRHALAITASTMAASAYRHGVVVYSPLFKTDTQAAWYHHGCKWFHGEGRARAEQEQARSLAIAWVAETYGYRGEWVGNRMRDKVPAIVQKRFPIPGRAA
jgi:hypothetical protein